MPRFSRDIKLQGGNHAINQLGPKMSLEAKTSLISDLEKQESELQTSITDAASSGGDTVKPRGQLKTVQARLTAARNDVAAMKSAGREAAANATAQIGGELAGAAIDRIVNTTKPFAEILTAGVPALDFAGHAAITSAAQNLAAARQLLSDAETDHASMPPYFDF